jgi:hypothetical protein
MRTYLIDIGNSGTGQIGCCAYVKAKTKQSALRRFRDQVGYHENKLPAAGDEAIETINVYFNPAKITLDNIRLAD